MLWYRLLGLTWRQHGRAVVVRLAPAWVLVALFLAVYKDHVPWDRLPSLWAQAAPWLGAISLAA